MRFTWRTVSDVLSDKELMNAFGGYGDAYGCGEWTDHGIGTCGFKVSFNNGGCFFGCRMPKAEALHYINDVFIYDVVNSWWCCDNCGTSTYCG